ncbi:hypothetical protein EU508_05340 [Pseudoalteromonas fuliginea]|uniref:Uncharacterized protein n=1 Tax=Pseudoalteromonas fuliginea TaxID=1872678 RepID=A0AB73BJV6_9GAMM|nr:hypothetical protein [Pseudoalteromonas fuliginea]KAA1162765.1 hypothetical protein EU508_05340 [Pseudoalteromonas fuliginea]
MEDFSKLKSIVDLYFSKKYKLYKPKDADGEEINKSFEFESRAKFLDSYLEYYQQLPDLESVIIDACTAKFKVLYEGQEYTLKHTHQEEFIDRDGKSRGVGNTVLFLMRSELIHKGGELREAQSFEDVYEIVKNIKVNGFGELSNYDTAIRISSYLGFKPKDIYLHAGTKVGAEYLENKGLLPKDSRLEAKVPIDVFPQPFQALDAFQIENFLCSFKDNLKEL